MKFSQDQVREVLERSQRPLSTSDIRERCNEIIGRQRYAGGSHEVRDALDAMEASGEAVKSKGIKSWHMAEHADEPYAFVGVGESEKSIYWMMKINADEYKKAIDVRTRAKAEATAKAQRLAALLGGNRARFEVTAQLDGSVQFDLRGEGGQLDLLLRALEALRQPVA